MVRYWVRTGYLASLLFLQVWRFLSVMRTVVVDGVPDISCCNSPGQA